MSDLYLKEDWDSLINVVVPKDRTIYVTGSHVTIKHCVFEQRD